VANIDEFVGAFSDKNYDYSPVYNFAHYQSSNSDLKSVFGPDDTGTLGHFIKWGMEEGSRRKVGSMEERRRYWQYVQIKDDAETMERRVKEITEPVRNLHFPFSLLRKIKNAA
jgi:hypothetical protein